MKKGAYIVVEGGEGAGKDTQVALLREYLRGEEFVFTREPGGTALGKELRAMLLQATVALPTEIFLFLADRAQHAEEIIFPALAEGKTVVSNRSWPSFIAYQIHGRQQPEWEPFLREAIVRVYKDAPIDLMILLDVDPSVGRARKLEAGTPLDAIEQAGLEMHERVRTSYLALAKELPGAVVIDANRPKDAVWTDVFGAVQSLV